MKLIRKIEKEKTGIFQALLWRSFFAGGKDPNKFHHATQEKSGIPPPEKI